MVSAIKPLPPPQARTYIRWMIRRDMPRVTDIEKACPQPWVEEDFLRCLRQRNCIGMVAEQEGRVIAYMIYELRKGSLEILRLAVHPRQRRRGVGRHMIQKLESKLSSHRRTWLLACVPEHSLDVQLFLKATGFEWTRTKRHSDGDEYQMERHVFPSQQHRE